jgi:SAM-dependent methyltransferase
VILKTKALLSGLATYLPIPRGKIPTGGTGSARYCYAVWFRHLLLARAAGAIRGVPRVVAELGPGDSIGIGLAALLSGAERYFALDVVKYSNLRGNLAVLDELIELFRARAAIPDDREFPHLVPRLDDYSFPADLLPADELDKTLEPERIAEIRRSVKSAEGESSRIVYRAPWSDPAVIEDGSVDMIFSHAVLEHVEDAPGVYAAMCRWLKPDGVMSHQIDYGSHGKADSWNGHWTYSDFAWRVVVGRRPYLLNRIPHSRHMQLLASERFAILRESRQQASSVLRRRALAKRFRSLSDEDLTTRGAHVIAIPLK